MPLPTTFDAARPHIEQANQIVDHIIESVDLR